MSVYNHPGTWQCPGLIVWSHASQTQALHCSEMTDGMPATQLAVSRACLYRKTWDLSMHNPLNE